MTGHEVVSLRDAAVLLGVHENTVRNWIRSGRLPAEKRGQWTLPLKWAVEAVAPTPNLYSAAEMLEARAAEYDAAAKRLRSAAQTIREGTA